jgi:hypothetical protein
MIQFQTQGTVLPTRSAAGRQGHRIKTVALVASVALVAHILSACSGRLQSGPMTSTAAVYPDLNDPPPSVAMHADDAAEIRARLIQLREDQERTATEQQQAVHQASDIEPSQPIDDEPPASAVFTFRR